MAKRSWSKRLWWQLRETAAEMSHTFARLASVGKSIKVGIQHNTWQLRIILPLIFFLLAGLYFFPALRLPGHIVHSDLDFGFQSEYLFRIFPLWNDTWSVANFFNMPRGPILFPLALLAKVFQLTPSLWQKLVIFTFLYTASISMYALIMALFQEDEKLGRLKAPRVFLYAAALLAGLFYAYNPYPIIRIQHLYLLVGYALMPMVFLFTIRLTEHFTRLSPQKERSAPPTNLWQKGLQKICQMQRERLHKKVPFSYVACSLIGLSLFWALSVGAVHYLFFNFLLVAAWGLYRLIRYILQRRWTECQQLTLRLVGAGFLTAGLLLYYLLPYLSAMTIDSVNPPNINSVDSVDMVSRNNLPHLALYLISYWWGLIDFGALPMTFWIGGGLLLGLVALAILVRIYNKFVLFFTGFTAVMYFLSLGTKWLPDIFVWLVFGNPLSGPIGFIFRDSNKFVGLLAFGMSILLAYGLMSLLEILNRLRKEHLARQGKKKALNYFTGLLAATIGGSVLALHFYFQPVHDLYFGQLYYPNPVPQSYTKAQRFLEENREPNFERSLMLPRYETLVTPGAGYAVATWNAKSNPDKGIPPRATSAMDIWSLGERTFHPQEGATPLWNKMYHYLFESLGKGQSENIGPLMRRLGIGRFIFHNDVLGLESQLSGVLKNLKYQENITPMEGGSFGFFDIFTVKGSEWAHLYARNLLTFSGLSGLDPLLHHPAFRDDQTAFLWGPQHHKSADLDHLKPHDVIAAQSKEEILLSQIKDSHLLLPFEATRYGNPFYRWSRLRTDTPDWSQQMKALGIEKTAQDFDFGKGVAYSFVPRMIALDPYQNFYHHGTPYHFASSLDKDEPLLESDVPQILTIQEGFTDAYDSLPSAFGKSVAGESDYWRVARTKKLPAKANNGYFFELVLSGRKAHLVHAKVKFFDAADEEVGIAYISAPHEVETFDFIKFKGLYVTPPETEKLQLEILSQQTPDLKSFWYLHDFTILDLEQSLAPNELHFKYQAQQKGPHSVFLRAFKNQKGGRVAFRFTKDERTTQKIISTRDTFQNRFQWYPLGSLDLEQGESYDLTFENIEGVNALNLVAVIPDTELEALKQKVTQKLETLHQLVLLDADIDFELLGHKQIQNHQPFLSNGKAVHLDQGFIRSEFEIFKPGTYKLSLRTKVFASEDGANPKQLHLGLQDKDSGKTVYAQETNLSGEETAITWLELPPAELDPGIYQMQIAFYHQGASLITLHDFGPWPLEDFAFTLDKDEPQEADCSRYVKYDPRDLTVALESNRLQGEIAPSASCDWVSLVSSPLSVEAGEHYLLRFENAVTNNRQFHFKALYFDRQNRLIDTERFHFPDEASFPSYRLEEIIQMPAETRFMRLQFLTRPHPQKTLRFMIKDFSLKNFEDLPMVDLFSLEAPSSHLPEKAEVAHVEKDLWGYQIELPPSPSGEKERYTLQLGESFTPLWTLKQGDQIREPFPSHLVLNAYQVTLDSKKQTVYYRFRITPPFLVGLALSSVTLVLALSALWYYLLDRWKSHET